MQDYNITRWQWRTLKRHEHITFLYTSVERPPKDKGMQTWFNLLSQSHYYVQIALCC